MCVKVVSFFNAVYFDKLVVFEGLGWQRDGQMRPFYPAMPPAWSISNGRADSAGTRLFIAEFIEARKNDYRGCFCSFLAAAAAARCCC